VTQQNQLFALDTRISVDGQSLFRQERLYDSFDPSYFGWDERQATSTMSIITVFQVRSDALSTGWDWLI